MPCVDFAAARAWQPFHTPKNLAMAMIVEAAELVEHFQWLTPEQSLALAPEKLAEVRDEAADTLIYLVELADVAEHRPHRRRARQDREERGQVPRAGSIDRGISRG